MKNNDASPMTAKNRLLARKSKDWPSYHFRFVLRPCAVPTARAHGPGRFGPPQHKKMGSDGSLLGF